MVGRVGRYLVRLLAFALLALFAVLLHQIFSFWWLFLWLMLLAWGQN